MANAYLGELEKMLSMTLINYVKLFSVTLLTRKQKMHKSVPYSKWKCEVRALTKSILFEEWFSQLLRGKLKVP